MMSLEICSWYKHVVQNLPTLIMLEQDSEEANERTSQNPIWFSKTQCCKSAGFVEFETEYYEYYFKSGSRLAGHGPDIKRLNLFVQAMGEPYLQIALVEKYDLI